MEDLNGWQSVVVMVIFIVAVCVMVCFTIYHEHKSRR